MAKGRLTEDEIKWILSVESTQAQQEIHKLTNANKELFKANKERYVEMRKLEAQGKKESDEYKNLKKVVDQANASIQKNSDKITALTNNMKISELTMSQLKKRANDLQRQLDGTSKATNPQQWEILNKQLKETRSRMDELKGASKNVSDGFSKIKSTASMLGLAAIGASILAFFKSSAEGALEEEKALQRLSFAIKKVAGGSDSDLEKLRKQAQDLMGIFTHEEIEGAATKMLNFGLTINQVRQLMPGMVDAAVQSGFSMEDMATAIDKAINSGVMAKSSLGQLGIIFKDTGDKAKNYGLVVDGLSKLTGGNEAAMKSQWGTLQNMKIRWDEVKEAIGALLLKAVVPLSEGFTKLFNNMGKSFEVKSFTDAFKDQSEKVVSLKRNIEPLLSRYDQLSTKVNKSASENNELKKIVEQVTEVMPSAVTAVDEYGNAISISTLRVRGFIDAEVQRYRVVYKDAIKQNENYLAKNEVLLKRSEQRIKEINKNGTFVIKAGDTFDGSYANYSDENATPEQVARALIINKELLNVKKGYTAEIERLNGTTLQKEVDAYNAKVKLDEANIQREAKYNAFTKAELLKLIKAKDDYAKTIYDKRFGSDEDGKSGKDKTDPLKLKVEQLDKELLAEQVSEKQKKQSKEDLNVALLALDEKYIALKRDVYKKDTAEYIEYQNQLEDIARNKSLTANQASVKSLSDSNKSVTTGIGAYETAKKGALLSKLEKNNTPQGQEEYDTAIRALDVELSKWRLQNAKDYADILRDTQFDSDADKAAAVEAADAAVTAAGDALLNANKAVLKNKVDQEKEHQDEVAKIRKDFGLDKEKLSYQEGLEALKAKLKEGLATEQQTADAVAKYKLSKVQEYAEGAAQVVGALSDLVNSLHESEISSLEAQKQKELSIAGNNADARQEIETRYAQKELDLKKKQADANMGISIAQAMASSALGIIDIWSKTGVNPVLAAILTAALVGITVANIASAVSQRDAIKNTTIPGAEAGGYIDVTRAQDGKVYRNAIIDPEKRGYVDRPTILVGEGGKEWVASNAAMKNPTVASFINILDQHQQAGTIRTLDMNQLIRANMAGYASGGFVTQKSSTTTIFNKSVPVSTDSEYLSRLVMVLEDLSQNGVIAPIVLSELEAKTALRDRSRNIGKK